MSAIASQSRRPFTPTLREGLAARPSQFARSTCFEAGHLTSVNAGWRSVRPVIDAEQCTLCLNCYMYCPDGTIAKVRDDEGVCVAVVVDYDFCKGCGVCAKVCPVPCIAMVDECGYTNWTFLACTVINSPFALTQNLLCALMKLREGGRCQAFASFHYDGDVVPDADNLLQQIRWFDQAGFDGIKMLDGKPGVRLRQNLPLDAPNYDKMFDYAQRTQFPILYHINDPIEFWYRDRLPQWAVEKNFFYGDGTFPHKFEIDEETFGFLRKHPNLNLCIPHFFFISDQPGLCCEMLDRYPNLFFDITPGWEMFENFAKDREYWRSFFSEYSHKILFGTDTFSDHWRETVTCLRRVLELSLIHI